jgi:ORF6N domain
MSEKSLRITSDRVEQLIFQIRGQKVMLSTHLAELYEVETRVLVQAVKRNSDRFPEDFMFQLTKDEFEDLKSQIVISSWGGMRRSTPYAFTEQGVAMLSSVLRSKRAVQVNIEIMRAFVKLRQMLTAHKDLERKIAALEKKYDEQFKIVFEAIRALMSPPEKSRKKIGFEVKEGGAQYSKKKKTR